MAKGRFLDMKGKQKEEEEVSRFVVRLPPELRQRLRAVAIQLGLSDNEAIVLAVAAFVEDKALHAAIRELSSGSFRRRWQQK
jgi:predicted DNA-binding protein